MHEHPFLQRWKSHREDLKPVTLRDLISRARTRPFAQELGDNRRDSWFRGAFIGYAGAYAEPRVIRDAFLADTPMKRVGTPEDVAYTALFLASDEASYVTGANYAVDGGATVM